MRADEGTTVFMDLMVFKGTQSLELVTKGRRAVR